MSDHEPSPATGQPPGHRILVLGGARSGKSEFAESLLAGRDDVTYVAPSCRDDGDAAWAARIAAHRARRPAAWRTEETVDVAPVLRDSPPAVIVDSVSAWLTGVMDTSGAWEHAGNTAFRDRVDELVDAWVATPAHVVAVSDEVGSGVVPETSAGRLFRDELGSLNQRLAAAADEVWLVTAGIPQRLRPDARQPVEPQWKRLPRTLLGLADAVALFTILPTRKTGDAAQALRWAPAIGAGLGLVGATIVALGDLARGAPVLVAALTVAALSWLTRGFHLGGLADTADGLGALRDAQESLAVMRRSDIGPFGVAAVALVLLLQTAALSGAIAQHRGAAAIVLAVVTGRLAMVRAGLPGIPPARETGLGATVARTVPPAAFIAAVGVTAGLCTAPVLLGDPVLALRLLLALGLGLLAAEALLRRVRRRLGGVTGDVFGAVSEVATTVTLVTLALG